MRTDFIFLLISIFFFGLMLCVIIASVFPKYFDLGIDSVAGTQKIHKGEPQDSAEQQYI